MSAGSGSLSSSDFNLTGSFPSTAFSSRTQTPSPDLQSISLLIDEDLVPAATPQTWAYSTALKDNSLFRINRIPVGEGRFSRVYEAMLMSDIPVTETPMVIKFTRGTPKAVKQEFCLAQAAFSGRCSLFNMPSATGQTPVIAMPDAGISMEDFQESDAFLALTEKQQSQLQLKHLALCLKSLAHWQYDAEALHKDAHRGNFLINADGSITLTDFGLSKPLSKFEFTQNIAPQLRCDALRILFAQLKTPLFDSEFETALKNEGLPEDAGPAVFFLSDYLSINSRMTREEIAAPYLRALQTTLETLHREDADNQNLQHILNLFDFALRVTGPGELFDATSLLVQLHELSPTTFSAEALESLTAKKMRFEATVAAHEESEGDFEYPLSGPSTPIGLCKVSNSEATERRVESLSQSVLENEFPVDPAYARLLSLFSPITLPGSPGVEL